MYILLVSLYIISSLLASDDEGSRKVKYEEIIVDIPEYIRPAFIKWSDDYVFYYDYETVTLYYHKIDYSDNSIPEKEPQSYQFNRGQGPGEVQNMIGGISYQKNKNILMVAVPQNERIILLEMPGFEHVGDISIFDSAGILSPHLYNKEFIVYNALFPTDPETFFSVCTFESDMSVLKECSTIDIELDYAESDPEYIQNVSKGGHVVYKDEYIYFAHSRTPVIRTFNINTLNHTDKIIYDESAMPDVVYGDEGSWLEGIADFNGLAKVDDRFFVLAAKNKRFRETRDYWARNNDDRYLNNVIYEVATQDDGTYKLEEFIEFDQYVLEISQHKGYMYAILSDDSKYTENAHIVKIKI